MNKHLGKFVLAAVIMLLLIIIYATAFALPVRDINLAAECRWRAVLAARAAQVHQAGLRREQFHWTDEDDNTPDAEAQRAAVDAGWAWEGSPQQIAQKVFTDCYGEEEI